MKEKLLANNLAPVLEDLGIHFESNDQIILRKSLETDQLVLDAEDKNCVIAKISSINVDRSGDILIPDGIITDEYEQNPVIFTNHNYAQLPVAKMVKIQKTSNAVYGKYQFSETPEAQAVLKLIKEGILKANSVGFIALETLKRGTTAFTKYVNEHFNGIVDKSAKQIITKWKLLENSLVGIGCNKDAMVLAISKGLVDNKECNPISIEESSNKIQEKSIENTQPVVETSKEQTISEQVEHISEEIKDVVKDVEKVVETVVEEVKPVIERFIKLVSKPEETIKKEIEQDLIKKKSGKIF